jgi:hypothetical protein
MGYDEMSNANAISFSRGRKEKMQKKNAREGAMQKRAYAVA